MVRIRTRRVYACPLWLEMQLVQAFMPVLVICKFEEDPLKTEGAIVSTIFFSSAQGQATRNAMDKCVRNSNLFELLWSSWLSASLMMIR